MKKNSLFQTSASAWALPVLLIVLYLVPARILAADQTWTGAGGDGFWHNGGNWAGGILPSAGDSLSFSGTVGLANTNNFSMGTAFSGITFKGPGGFTLSGNSIGLAGGITNRQVVTPESINLSLSLSASQDIDVVGNGLLAINSAISGAGGITKTGDGVLTLSGANSFTGPVGILGGKLAVNSAGNLGAPSRLSIDKGALETTASLALNSSMGIALGPNPGAGAGTLTVDSGTTLSYGGVIANNGSGPDGLTKNGFGTLVLSGANTYTGSTSNRVGTLTLDFSQPGAPLTNIISPSSFLILGGENAGFGALNFAQLNLVGGGGAANSQTFNGTHVTFASSVILATNGPGGTANLDLGALDHDPGGTLTLITPALGGGGNIITSSTNVNGILGGWATLGDGSAVTITGNNVANSIILGTDFASVDPLGHIVNFTGYTPLANGQTIHSISTAAANLLITSAVTGDMLVDNDNAGTLTDVNAINWNRTDNGVTLKIGIGNTLRLGRFGAIFKPNTTSGLTWLIGETPKGANGPDQNIGILTAGGADNTPGEIVVDVNCASSSSGTLIIDSQITDNGSAPVTFVKTGAGSMKLRGHNTFSGGTFLLQGRVQFVGGEGGVGTGNADAGGTGPIYILPGCYLFPSGAGPTTPVTNAVFIAGNGTAGEPLGAIRTTGGWLFNGPWTLIGDTTIGGNGGASGAIGAKLSGPFNLSLCSPVTVNGTVSLTNSQNDWSGTTTMNASPHGANTFLSGNSEIIPNGFGKGNVLMNGLGADTITWNMNGFNETINGLSSSGVGASCFIVNNGPSPSSLTIGDNDQSGVFAGAIQDGANNITLTKIGGGVEMLTGNNTYSGPTLINGGALALSGAGSIATSSSIQVNPGAALDVSGVTGGFSSFNPIGINGGSIIGNTSASGITSLGLTNSSLALSVDPSVTNLVVGSLTTGGANTINISSVFNVPSYPALFTLLKYTGAIAGSGYNFTLGTLPTSTTLGYVSNDTANASVVLVLTSGPKALTWAGNVNNDWDIATTANWTFSGNPVQFNNLDSAFFDDTAATTTVNLATVVLPGAITVYTTNGYTFTGNGAISGATSLTKNGSGPLTLLETGGDTFNGGVAVNEGAVIFGADNAIAGGLAIGGTATVQVGTNGGTGTLPSGGVADNGALTFNRGADLVVPNPISGTGVVSKIDSAILTLSGGNGALAGAVSVAQGTLKAGSSSALGAPGVVTTVSSGATLDVNGQQLNNVTVVVSGAGAGGQGAIVNSGPDNINALGWVTLAGNTTFGGTGRWDIRGGAAQLLTVPPSSPYTLTKIGPNQVSLVGLTVDAGLGDINVLNGLLSVETTTGSLGDPNHTLTVAPGAELQFYNSTISLGKKFVLNGTGTNTTLNCGSGIANSVGGPVVLNGNCLFNAASVSALTFNGALSGSGSFIKTGSGTNVIAGVVTASYGSTIISNGTLAVEGTVGSNVAVYNGGILGGFGAATGNVGITNGILSPGDANLPLAMLTLGALVLDNATCTFELSTAASSGNDQVVVTGGLTLSGTNTLQIVPPATMNPGDVYTLFRYSGAPLPSSATNNLIVLSTQAGFTFSIVDPATTPGAINLLVQTAIGDDLWTGATSSIWDNSTTNWTRNAAPAVFNNLDFVSFDDSSSVTNVSLSGALTTSGITMNNASRAYTFSGSGKLTGKGGLHVAGSGLTIANQGSNDFTGPITIDFGILQVGNGGANGNLGSSILTNNGSLVFDRTGSLMVNNSITGTGSLTNIGTGIVTLSGASTFDGEVDVFQGTLQINNNAALGSTVGNTVVTNGATLDLGGPGLASNGLNLGQEHLFVSGGGVGGKGVIVNNGSQGQIHALQVVSLTGDATFGGTQRWDIRAANATSLTELNTAGQSFNLTKVGANQISLVGVAVDPALSNIVVLAGMLGVEAGTTSLGDTNATISIASNATLEFYQLVATNIAKPLVLSNAATVLNNSGANVYAGPISLEGDATFNIGGTSFTQSNSISGTGGLIKSGGSPLLLAGPLTFAGQTKITAGRLALVGDSLTASSLINIAAGMLDLSQASSPTLTLLSGQTLEGAGTIWGSVIAGAGSTVAPGSLSALTVTNTITLQGQTVMELNAAAGTADQLAAASIAYGGALTVTNVNGALASGNSFKLFSAPSLTGTFDAITLTALSPGLYWSNTLAVDGKVAVAGALQVRPILGILSSSQGSFVLSGTNGTPGATYYVLSTTNVALPLSEWTPIATNQLDSSGAFHFTNSESLSQQYFILQLP